MRRSGYVSEGPKQPVLRAGGSPKTLSPQLVRLQVPLDLCTAPSTL